MPRIYLATPDVDDPSPLIASLPPLLAGADVAAVLVRLKPTDQRTMISRVKALAPAVQDSGAALLLDGHVVTRSNPNLARNPQRVCILPHCGINLGVLAGHASCRMLFQFYVSCMKYIGCYLINFMIEHGKSSIE